MSNNNFEIGRGLGEISYFIQYKNEAGLSRSLISDVQDLKYGDHFIDSGAGIGTVVADILIAKSKGRIRTSSKDYRIRRDPIAITALSFVKPPGWETQTAKHIGTNESVRYLEGSYVENIPTEVLTSYGKAKLILDSVGPLSYTAQPHTVLQKYLDALRDDGGIDIYFGKLSIRDPVKQADYRIYRGHGENYHSEVLLPTGERLTLLNWLKTLDGIKVLTDRSSWGARIEKTKSDVKIPELEIIEYVDGYPPFRIFRLKPSL